jgi:hypothetical protein
MRKQDSVATRLVYIPSCLPKTHRAGRNVERMHPPLKVQHAIPQSPSHQIKDLEGGAYKLHQWRMQRRKDQRCGIWAMTLR